MRPRGILNTALKFIGCMAGMYTLAPAADTANLEALVQQARQEGVQWQSSRDDNVRKSAKRRLEQVERALKDAVRKEPDCQRCYELLTASYYYQTFFQFENQLENCVETAEKGLSRFPSSERLALFKGYAHYQGFQFLDANRSFQRILSSPGADPAIVADAKKWMDASQQQFLANWSRQANFYNSRESRIEVYNPQTRQMEIRFQVTPDWERQLGAQGFTSIAGSAPKLEDAEVQRYVEGIVGRLVSRNPGSPFDYQIALLNSREVNAVTPPGHVIVYRGLLEFADNEAELAGVLAHELAHNYAHHSARAYIKGLLAQGVANAFLQAMNPQSPMARSIAAYSAQFGLMLVNRAYSRFEEKEADLYAAHIMFNAGYNPTAASSFHLKMYKSGAKAPVKFLSTHPPSADRASYYTDYLEGFPLDREMQMDSKTFQQIRARLTGTGPAAPGAVAAPPPLR